MGINCQINLFKPSDGAYLAGSTVSGIIKYGVDEVTIFDKITVSLKGHGLLTIRDKRRQTNNSSNHMYRHREVYVDTDNVINNEKKQTHEIGMYETRFDFKLPDHTPSSLNYQRRDTRYIINCNIVYYIRIKFEKPGFLQFAKRFKKKLTVISGIKPKLLNEPIIYGEQKKLFQLFSSKDSIVNIKANIRNSVIPPGGKIDLEYEIWNDSSVNVKGVQTKLMEIYTFTTASGRVIKMSSDIDNTESKTGSIKSDEKQNFEIVLNMPSDKTSLGFSSIVSRDYFVRITAELPFPHINVTLLVPVEIGDIIGQAGQNTLQDIGIDQAPPEYDNPPPSYWEIMGEETKDDDFDSGKSGKKS